MYGTKCLLVGLFAGMAIGASSSLVQSHLRTICNYAKNTVHYANDKLDEMKSDIKNIDVEDLKQAVDEKIEEFKDALTSLKENISKEELTKSLHELSSKIENLFQEFRSMMQM